MYMYVIYDPFIGIRRSACKCTLNFSQLRFDSAERDPHSRISHFETCLMKKPQLHRDFLPSFIEAKNKKLTKNFK